MRAVRCAAKTASSLLERGLGAAGRRVRYSSGACGHAGGAHAAVPRRAQAFSNTLKRMLEAAGRGRWQADAATLERLQGMYTELGDELEGV